MEFRPCIDIHNGKVKQIIGGSLKDAGDQATENYVAEQDAVYFAKLYQKEGIKGGHIILLNPASSTYYKETRAQAELALGAYPGGLQIGGGITAENAKEFLDAGASHVIVTSYVFWDGKINYENLARLKYALGEHLGVDSRSVHSFIIGEHGDSEIAAWSSTNVSGIPLNTFCEMRGHFDHDHAMDRIAEDVKNSAYDIISKKQATYYGIAMSVKRICECIIRNERSILPVSSMMHGEYGIDGISLSMPAIVGLTGIETHVPIALNAEEAEKLRASAETLKKIAATLEL